jgi:hypothetical protein
MGAGAHRSSRFFARGLRPSTHALICWCALEADSRDRLPGLQIQNRNALGSGRFEVYR